VKIPGWDNPQVNILELVSNWLCEEANGRWVMVVDNADDIHVFSQLDGSHTAHNLVQVAQRLSDFLPQSPNGSILITSRSRDAAYKLTGKDSDIIEVKPMDKDQSITLLKKKLPGNLDRNEGVELVHSLDYMPLAITQAAAYISQRSPRITVSKYIRDLRESDKDRAGLLNKDAGDTRRDGRASNSIMATWQITFEYIRKERPSAARLLSLMSLFDRQGIPEALLLEGYYVDNIAEADFEDDISILTSFSLVTMNIDGNEFEMHRLVQLSTKKWLELCDELESWKERYIVVMDQAFPIGEYENWVVCQHLFPHAEMVLLHRPTNKDYLERWASILYNAAWYSNDKGNYEMAEKMNRRAVDGYDKVLGAEHPSTLKSISNLALTFWNQGRWKEAEELEVQVMETRKRVLGAEHPSTLTSMANLASTYTNQGRWKEAEELEVQVMETRLRVLGTEHPDTLTSVANLASTYRDQGRWDQAEDLQAQGLKLCSKVLGAEHPDTLTSMANLASTYMDQGRWKEAEELEVQVMETRLRVLGAEHPDTLTIMANLASTFRNQGQLKEAEELEVQVMETRKRVLGAEHPSTLNSISNLASTFWNQGRWKEAEELEVQVMETRLRVLGAEHPSTLTSMANLASTYRDQGRWKEAEELQARELKLCSKVLGTEHPDTLISMNNLASIWKSQGSDQQAIDLLSECVQLQQQNLGADHPFTEKSRQTLQNWQASL
jgi:tetratricopeptide (TPR) repeat protein